MSVLEKATEQFPLADGGLRRQLIAGLIFTFVYTINFVALLPGPGITSITLPNGLKASQLLNSTSLLIALAGFVFAVGSIIDIFAEGFFMRGVSTTYRVLQILCGKGRWWHWVWFVIVVCATICFWPLAIVVATILSTGGITKLRVADITRSSTSPAWVKELDEPYSNGNEFAWQALSNELAEVDKLWLSRVASRNRDLASFLAASFLALFISLIVQLAFRWQMVFAPMDSTLIQVAVSYVVLCVNSWMLFGCVNIVCRNSSAAYMLFELSERKKRSPASSIGSSAVSESTETAFTKAVDLTQAGDQKPVPGKGKKR